jgi:hypothetical protein
MRALDKLSAPVRVLDSDIHDGLDFSLLQKSAFQPNLLRNPTATRKSRLGASGLMEPSREAGHDLRTPGRQLDSRQRMIRELGALYPFNKVIVVSSMIEIRDTRIEPMQRFDVESKPISLDAAGVMFSEPVNFSGTTFQGGVRLSRAAFLDGADFVGATFLDRVTFDAAWFGNRSSFARAKFAGTSLLSFARFASQTVFQGAEFAGLAAFDDSRFCGDTDFGEARFTGGAQFPSLRTAGDAVFAGAAFPKGASFLGAEFAEELNLTNIQSDSLLIFTSASAGTLRIGSGFGRGTTFIGAALDFNGSGIHTTVFENVIFARPLTFLAAQLGQAAVARNVFRDSDVRGDRRMADAPARFGCESGGDKPFLRDSKTVLDGVTFRDDVSFRRATFRGQTSFSEINFNKTADLTDVTFKARVGERGPEVRFSRVNAEAVNVEWKNMPELSDFRREAGDPPVSSMLEELETGYHNRNRPADALRVKEATGWMKWYEARACLIGGGWAQPRQKVRESCEYLSSAFRFIALPLWGFSSGFGTSLKRLAILIFIIDALFAFSYMCFGRIVRNGGSNRDSDSAMRLRFLEPPASFGDHGRSRSRTARLAAFREALALSTVILLRFGAKNVRVYGRIGWMGMGTVVIIEWVLGIFLLVDLVYTLQSQPFVQAVLHGLVG